MKRRGKGTRNGKKLATTATVIAAIAVTGAAWALKLLHGVLDKLTFITCNELEAGDDHLPLRIVFRLHVAVGCCVAIWLQTHAASLIRWAQTFYWAAISGYYSVPALIQEPPVPFSSIPGASFRNTLYMLMSACLILSVPARHKLLGILQWVGIAGLLVLAALSIPYGGEGWLTFTVSLAGLVTALVFLAALIGRVSAPSLICWAAYAMSLSARPEVWSDANPQHTGILTYYILMFGRVAPLIEFTLSHVNDSDDVPPTTEADERSHITRVSCVAV